MITPPDKPKAKNKSHSIVKEQIKGADYGCVRGIVVFSGLLLMFGAILFVMSRL